MIALLIQKFVPRGWVVPPVLLGAALLAGCGRADIAVYRAPKDPAPQASAAPDFRGGGDGGGGGEAAVPRVQGKAPEGWQEQAPSGMSVMSYLITGAEGRKAQLSVMTFPGEGAGELNLLNIVRENAGLPPMSDAELAGLVEPVSVGAGPAKLVDLTGAVRSSSNAVPSRILVAVSPRGGVTWFFKLAGDAGIVTAQKKAFVDFLKSVAFVDPGGAPARGAHFASTNEKRDPDASGSGAPGARPAWEVPAGWQEAAPGQMLLARFQLGGAESKTEVTVSAFPGDTGGLLANVNRWRGQVGLQPVEQAQADKDLATLDLSGARAMLLDVSGKSPRNGAPTRLVGAIVPREGQTWFYKLMGDPAVVEHERQAFVQFVKSVRYSHD